MSRIYSASIIYGVKLKIKVSGYEEVGNIFVGEHDLSRKAVELGLRAHCRSMSGYLDYEDGDAYSGDFYGRLGAQVKFNQNWGINGDVKIANGGDTQWFVGPRFSW